MSLLHFKALHLIFAVTWFAGLFYIVRLFVYYAEAKEEEEPARSILTKQYKLMMKRLWYGITWPSMILIVGFGTAMLVVNPGYLLQTWFHIKLALLIGLVAYHLYLGRLYQKIAKGTFTSSSMFMRIINEVATLFLVGIVFVATVGRFSLTNWMYGVGGFVLLAILLMLGIKLYKKLRGV